jgi:hypothetical protein
MRQRMQPGQNLSEYVLAISLVVVLSLGGLSVLAQSQKGFLNNIYNMLAGGGQAVQAPAPVVPAPNKGNNNNGLLANTFNLPVKGSPQVQAAFENYKNTGSMEALVETAGASGTTNVLLESLINAASLQLQGGKISQASYDQIINLSNKGHRLADVQGLVEKTFAQCNGDLTCYKTAYVEYENFTHLLVNLDDMTANTHQYTEQASSMTTVNGGKLGATHMLLQPSGHGNWWMKDFLTQWETVQGELSGNAELKAMVDRLSLEIAVVNGTASIAINNFQSGEARHAIQVGALNASVAEAVSRYNSQKICETGQGKNEITFCGVATTPTEAPIAPVTP